ncbi:unnamed protein product [Trichogramma brassicae]|uniref:Uncharacterized protein n=1 Tax=Trichogramma brassicae TaxID=86971 RepID=A0A6H5HY88_9HYME|nr:unnamed protein product [Trichogramma brassicae]
MADGGPPDDQDICRCYTPGQTELDQSKAGAESPTNATGGIADNAARMVEDLAWQAETDEWWSTQLFSPQPETLPPTREGTDVEDLIAWPRWATPHRSRPRLGRPRPPRDRLRPPRPMGRSDGSHHPQPHLEPRGRTSRHPAVPEKRYKQFSRVPHPGYLVALPGETPRGRYERILRLFEEIRTPAEDRQRVLRECFPDGTPRAEKDPNARK